MNLDTLKAWNVPDLVKSGDIRRGAVYDLDPGRALVRRPETEEWARGWTALMQVAAGNPDPDVFTILADCGFDPLEASPHGVNALMAAVACNPVREMAATCLECGIDVMSRDRHGLTPVHLAALNNSPSHVNLLVDWGADVGCVSARGDTPLMMSALRKDEGGMARHLVKLGAGLDDADDRGVTPLMFALGAGNSDAALVLVEAGAGVDVRDSEGRSPLDHYTAHLERASASGSPAVLEALGENPDGGDPR